MNVDLSPAIVQLGYFVWGWLGPYYSNEPRILTQSSTKQYLMGAYAAAYACRYQILPCPPACLASCLAFASSWPPLL